MSRSDTHSLIDRLFLAHRALREAHRPIEASALQIRLGNCSRKQLQKTIFHLRDVLGAPLRYDEHSRGWHYDRTAPAFELPGLWFTATELHALLAAGQLLEQADPGILAAAIAPVRTRIAALLRQGGVESTWRADAVRVSTPMLRRADRRVFALAAQATLAGRQLQIDYRARSHSGTESRAVSPLRLEHYRGNWYLRAWCHLREGWRHFALERIDELRLLPDAASFPQAEPEAAAFGLFEGAPSQRAVLCFSRERARWIADEEWHPQQQQRWLPDGRLELELPYADSTELLLDILRYGPDVEVLAPSSLRVQVQERLRQALTVYTPADAGRS
ncbi:MAG: YafY family transcriptional regulator [Xanthomonadales bacterium]|nr:YafY family transcriptional regulator [Xanthomonadales bacterium]